MALVFIYIEPVLYCLARSVSIEGQMLEDKDAGGHDVAVVGTPPQRGITYISKMYTK